MINFVTSRFIDIFYIYLLTTKSLLAISKLPLELFTSRGRKFTTKMRLIFFIGILAVLGGHSITEGANFFTAGKNLLGSTFNIGKGVAKAIPSYLDPAQILDLGKQSILGYPVNLLAEAINSVCK